MTTQEMLDDRYGRRGRPRRAVWIVLGVVAAAVVVYFGWNVVAANLSATDADGRAFSIVDEHEVSITFQVTAPMGESIACALEALDVEHGTVGWRVVEYPGSEAHTRAFTETVPTLSLATTGLIKSCWVT